ncbi:hypothetical protein Emag_005513 [Eimeria magna]
MAARTFSICLWCFLLCWLPLVSPDQSSSGPDYAHVAAAIGCSCCLVNGPEESHAGASWISPGGSLESFICRAHSLLCEALYRWRLDDREVYSISEKCATAHIKPISLKPQPVTGSIASDETDSNTRPPVFPCAEVPLRVPLHSPSHMSEASPRRLSETALASLEEPRTLASLCLLALASFVAVATGTGGVGFGMLIGHCLPAWAVALLLTALSMAMTIKAGKHHGAFDRCVRRWRCCRVRSVKATEAEVHQSGEEDGAASHSKRNRYTQWASRIVSHLVPPVSNQPGGVRSPDESLSAGGLSVHISCQAQQERRQPRHSRTQGIASMLDMRVDSGVWLLHPGAEAIETPGVPPAASNVASPHRHPSSDDDPGASSNAEAGAEGGGKALQRSNRGEGQLPGAHSDFCRPGEGNASEEGRGRTQLVTDAEARQTRSVRDLRAASLMGSRHWGGSPELVTTRRGSAAERSEIHSGVHAARTPPSKRGRVPRKKASLACEELSQRRMKRLKMCGLACWRMRNTTDAAESQDFEGLAEVGEVRNQRKAPATGDELRVLRDANRSPFEDRLASRFSSMTFEGAKHAVDDTDRQVLPDSIQQALETKREAAEVSQYAGGHQQENGGRQEEAQADTFCSGANLHSAQSRASFLPDHQDGSTCVVSSFCSPSAPSPRKSTRDRPPSTSRGSLASVSAVVPESSSFNKAIAAAARHASLSSPSSPGHEGASKPQLQADKAGAQTGPALDATKRKDRLLMAAEATSAQGRSPEEQRRQRLAGEGQRASASPTDHHETKKSRPDPYFPEVKCGNWSCGEPQEGSISNNAPSSEEKAIFDEFSDDGKDAGISKGAFPVRLEGPCTVSVLFLEVRLELLKLRK